MILKTAWKNVWRNRTRSMVVIASVTIGIFAGVFAVGLMNGTIEQRTSAALNQEISHIQINREGFRDNFESKLSMKDIKQQNEMVLGTDGVEAVSNRLIINGIANTASKSAGIQIIGINPEQEKAVLDLDEAMIPGTGNYFEEKRSNLIYIGESLAKDLNIIRYIIDQAAIDSLQNKGLPEETCAKLEPFLDLRFPSEKAFVKEMKKVLDKNETKKYAKTIKEEAWSFRTRSKITLSFVDVNNYQTGGMFRIAGIYDVKNTMFEESQVFVLNEDLRRITGMPEDEYHLSLVRVFDRNQAKEIANNLDKKLPDLQVQGWKEISPDLAMMTAMVEKFNLVFMIIILAALSFGIVNTMLMVVLERTKELGMLTAIGMNKKKVFSMIMSESVFLSLVGGVVGMLVSILILSMTASKGINIQAAAEGFEAMGFSAHIFPTVTGGFFIGTTILIIITGVLSSIYPALKALRLDPSEALRTE